MKLLSVVVPCYNEEETVADFYTEILKNELFFFVYQYIAVIAPANADDTTGRKEWQSYKLFLYNQIIRRVFFPISTKEGFFDAERVVLKSARVSSRAGCSGLPQLRLGRIGWRRQLWLQLVAHGQRG